MVDILGELKIVKTVNNKWDIVTRWGILWLPFIFLRTTYLDGKKIRLQKWITSKQLDEVNEHVDDLIENIKWE